MDKFYQTFDSPPVKDELSDLHEYEYPKTGMPKKGGQLWTDVLQEETLEEGMKGQVSIHDTFIDRSIKVDRESESFKVVPASRINADNKRSLGASSVSYKDNELFTNVSFNSEDFGVRSKAERIQQELDFTPYSRKHPEIRAMKSRKRRHCVDNNKKFDGFLSHRYDRLDSAENDIIEPKKPKKKKHSKMRNYVPRHNFSYEDLYNSEVPSNLSVAETGEWIAQKLGERDTVPIENAFAKIGICEGTKLFNMTILTEKMGGLKTNDGSRRRTPGGVFFEHLRNSDTISQKTKDEISQFGMSYFNSSKKTGNH